MLQGTQVRHLRHDAQAPTTTHLLSLASAATTAFSPPLPSSPRSFPRPAALDHRNHLLHILSMQLANAHRNSALVAAHPPPFPCSPDRCRSALFVMWKASRHQHPGASHPQQNCSPKPSQQDPAHLAGSTKHYAHEGTVRHGDQSTAPIAARRTSHYTWHTACPYGTTSRFLYVVVHTTSQSPRVQITKPSSYNMPSSQMLGNDESCRIRDPWVSLACIVAQPLRSLKPLPIAVSLSPTRMNQ